MRAARVLDAGLAAGFLVAMAVERGADRTPQALALSAVIAGVLLARRRHPLAAYLIGSAALSAEALLIRPSGISPYANLIALYSLGLYATRRGALLGPPIVVAGMVAYYTGLDPDAPVPPLGVLFFWLLAWALGYMTARRQEERVAARRLLREQVAADERGRLARELHDLVGHTVNVMLVQAGAARRVLDRDPAQTRELLEGLEHAGREALDELDRVLGLLGRADAPGLGDLPGLAARLTGTGLEVRLAGLDGVGDLPRGVSLSAYRIVQEALTNAVKHGRARTAQVSVRRAGDGLTIEVSDDGGGGSKVYEPGRGLLGIAERVAMLDGTLTHGPAPGGGFQVRAVLPLTGAVR
jgi:signal transduction histidine kinase